MTTDVHERLIAPIAPRRPKGLRAWLVFLVGLLLAALAIGVVAALLGNAVRGVAQAEAAEVDAQAAVATAQTDLASAQAALDAGQAAIDARREAIIEELAKQQPQSGFAALQSSPAFAEIRDMEAALQANEAAALEAATAAEQTAEAELVSAGTAVTAAQQEADRLVAPLWIAIAASVLVLGLLLWAAIARTRPARRR